MLNQPMLKQMNPLIKLNVRWRLPSRNNGAIRGKKMSFSLKHQFIEHLKMMKVTIFS